MWLSIDYTNLSFLSSIEIIMTDWSLEGQIVRPLFDFNALDTFGCCQRPVFLLGVSQHICERAQLVVEVARE